MPKTREVPTEPLPPLPEGYDPERAEHIREMWEAMHAAADPEEKRRLWNEIGDYILRSSE